MRVGTCARLGPSGPRVLCSQPKSAPRCRRQDGTQELRPAWLSGGFVQRQTMSQAAPIASPSLGQSAAWAALAGRTFQLSFSTRCAAWVARAEELQLETGDFVFAGGSWGLSRIHTGARRHSATRMVMDEGFAALMKTRLDGQVCPADYSRSPKSTECVQYYIQYYIQYYMQYYIQY